MTSTDSPVGLLLGLVTGVAFGFLLQRGRVAKLPVIVGQLLLRDWTVIRIMVTAIAVGALGVHVLAALGAADASAVKPLSLGGTIGGAVLFGLGIAALGYCPGTTVAASGAGHRDAAVGVLGMLAGAAAFVVGYPWLQPLLTLGARGELTLSDVTGLPGWVFVIGLLTAAAALALGHRGLAPLRNLRRRAAGPAPSP